MDLSYEDVEKILKLIDGSSLEELHIELGEFKLVVRKSAARDGGPEAPSPPGREESPASPAPATGAGPVARADTPEVTASAQEVAVKAPMVGIFYRAPSPGAPPFVEVGSLVEEDDTVCIIEVMKLMTSLRAGCRGRVAAIRVDNAALVEFGQTLMVIERRP
jgi:acetyl-CoA carboxylase biotin carboxyl carrier protein